jgi:flagellar biosynthesis/type III secretory pathway chaperone
MASSENLVKNSDSLVELLAAQCSDLEKLLILAKEETVAAKEGKFTRIWDIVTERSMIGKRLETFHQQIAELRGSLEAQGENIGKFDITNRVIELANLTLMQDQETRLLLADTRERTADELKNLERSHAGTNAYLRKPSRGLAYDRNI